MFRVTMGHLRATVGHLIVTVGHPIQMILGGCLYKNTFPMIFFSKFEEKNVLCMAEKYLVW